MAIYNEDGTEFNPPVCEEYNLLIRDCIYGRQDPYMCIFCNKCPLGDNFIPNKEQEEIINRNAELINAYIKEHNPTKGLEGITIPFHAE